MHKIKKAIIPIAGLATRMYPMNKVTKKALLPIYDEKDNRIKPIILKLLEELYETNIEEIYLIIGQNDEALYRNLFKKLDKKIYKKLNEEDIRYDEKIKKIGDKITYIIQKEQFGFGHAVYLAKKYIKNEPVLLLLGDTIYKSFENRSCIEQLLDFYDEKQNSIIALHEIEEDKLKYYGIVKGNSFNLEKNKMVLEKIVEKPSIDYAKANLLTNEKYYGNFGEFVLTKELFDELEKIVSIPLKENQEYQLMGAFEQLIKNNTVNGIIINGKSFDVGNINSYIQTMNFLTDKLV